MGLSIAISGAIILSVLMIVLMTITGFVGNMFTIGDVSSQIFEVENTIAKTDISLDALEASAGSPYVNFTLNNDDIEKLWNFENFNVLIEYDNAAGTVVEELSFNGDCSGISPPAGNWCIETIGADILDEGIINDGESADVFTRVSQGLTSANALVTVSTDNGVVAMLPAPKRSWIDAAPIPTITCEAGNYGRTFFDTDTGLSYVCDSTKDKWLSIETLVIWGEETSTCDDGNNPNNDDGCNVDWGANVGPEGGSVSGFFFPYNFTIISYGFSLDSAGDCNAGASPNYDLSFWGTESSTDNNNYNNLTQFQSGLTGQTNNGDLDVDIAGQQYTLWGVENNCNEGMNDWNLVLYIKWRHDQP